MRHLARSFVVLALAAWAAPALPCGAQEHTTASTASEQQPQAAKPAAAAKAEKEKNKTKSAKAEPSKPAPVPKTVAAQ